MNRGPVHAGHETRDASARRVAFVGAGLILGVVLSCIGVWLFRQAVSRGVTPQEALRDSVPAQPRAWSSPPEDLDAYLARERDILTSYAWIDRNRGVVRLPIDRAMHLLVERSRAAAAPSVPERTP